MRDKTTLLGMQSPEGTPGICEEVEIQITQPAGKAGSPEPGGGEPDCRRRGSSDWFVRIDGLARELADYRSTRGDPVRSRITRERFYQGVWELAGNQAGMLLRSWNWKGDVTQDAMDITAAFCEGLLKQEENRRGIFDSTKRSPSLVRGYLSNTIRNGVFQQAGQFAQKRRDWLRFEEKAVLSAADARTADWLPLVLRLTKAIDASRKRVRKMPADEIGTTPLGFVLQLALDEKIQQGGGVKDLLPSAGLTKRTRQRREKDFRDNLRSQLEM